MNLLSYIHATRVNLEETYRHFKVLSHSSLTCLSRQDGVNCQNMHTHMSAQLYAVSCLQFIYFLLLPIDVCKSLTAELVCRAQRK